MIMMRKSTAVVAFLFVMVVAIVAAVVGAGAQAASAAPVAAPAVQVSRGNVPTDDSPFYGVLVSDDGDDDPAFDVLPEVEAPYSVESAAWHAMLNAGGRGAVNDGVSATYMRVGTVLDFGTGTVTVTMFGPAICVDSEARRCSGGEFLTDHYMRGV